MTYSVPSPNEGIYNGQIRTLLVTSSVNQGAQSFVQQVNTTLTTLCNEGGVSMVDARLSRVQGDRDKPERYQFLLTYRQLPAVFSIKNPLRAAFITSTSAAGLETAVQAYFAGLYTWPDSAVPVRCFDISPNRNTLVAAHSVMVLYYAPAAGRLVVPGIERLGQRVYLFQAAQEIDAWGVGMVYLINADRSRVLALPGVNRRGFAIPINEMGYALFDAYTGRLNLYVFTKVGVPANALLTEGGLPIETENLQPLTTEGV